MNSKGRPTIHSPTSEVHNTIYTKQTKKGYFITQTIQCDQSLSQLAELSFDEIEQVSAAGTAEWGVGVGGAMGFLGMAIGGAAALSPVGMGILLGALIFSSGAAMYNYHF